MTYSIQVNDKSFDCREYEKYTFDFPVDHIIPSSAGIISFVLGLASLYEHKITVEKITILQLSVAEDLHPIYIIDQQAKDWLDAALDSKTSAIEEFFHNCKEMCDGCHPSDSDCTHEYTKDIKYTQEYALLHKIAAGDIDKKRIIISSTDDVIKQFAAQKLKETKRKKAAQAKRTRIQREYASKIITSFDEAGLLVKPAMTPQGKLDEFNKTYELCLEFWPELKDKRISCADVLSKHPDIDVAQCETFFKNWGRMTASLFALRRGLQGEEKVAEVLSLYDDRLSFLRNFRWGCEHDFVVLTPYGIFTIEVKTLRGDYVLTETGILKPATTHEKNEHQGTDVVLQSKRHIETMRRNLKSCPAFHQGIPLTQIICSGEGNFTIKNEFPSIPVCYYNTLDNILLPSPEPPIILDSDTIKLLKDFLLKHQEPEQEYDLFAPKGEIDSREAFINSFAAVASGIRG